MVNLKTRFLLKQIITNCIIVIIIVIKNSTNNIF